MEIQIGKLAGFCYGVKNAVEKAEELAKCEENVYCIGEIVHNKQVTESLENKGVNFADNIGEIPKNSTVIFRSHGMPKEAYEEANKKGLQIVDLTCPNVLKIHEKVEKMSSDGFIILLGKKNHAENIGTISFAGKNSYILEDEDEIIECYQKFEESKLNKVYVIAQTTYSLRKFDEMSVELEDNFAETEVIIDNTICSATELRQKETAKIAKDVNKMVIIGGKNSSNTAKLVEVSKTFCQNVYSVETKKDLNEKDFENNDKIGIMAGASTPKKSIDEVVEFLERNK